MSKLYFIELYSLGKNTEIHFAATIGPFDSLKAARNYGKSAASKNYLFLLKIENVKPPQD